MVHKTHDRGGMVFPRASVLRALLLLTMVATANSSVASEAREQSSAIIRLRFQEFDPLIDVPDVPLAYASASDTNLYFVQFDGPPLEEQREAVRRLGGEVYNYFPEHAHVVRLDRGIVADVSALEFVRWVGPYHPLYRASPRILQDLLGPPAVVPARAYNLVILNPTPERRAIVTKRIHQIGGTVESDGGFHLLTATLSLAQLLTVIRWDEVGYVGIQMPIETHVDLVRSISGATALENAGFTGTGVRGEVLDTGFRLDHVELQTPPLEPHTPVEVDSHGASVSGILFADGVANQQARGLLPDGEGIVAMISLVEGKRYDHTRETVLKYQAVFQNASVSSGSEISYGEVSMEMDRIIFDLDIVVCQSQGNEGMQSSAPEAWAKNVLSIGGIHHIDTLDTSDDHWDAVPVFPPDASHGPAEDGRIKPDLCFFNDCIFTISGRDPFVYREFFGTSAAAPSACGCVGLFFEMWSEGIFGNPVDPGGSVFENRSHATTAKAMLINHADQYDWNVKKSEPNHDIDRTKQGWGRPNVQSIYTARNNMLVVDETDVLTVQSSTTYVVDVCGGEPALKATLVYADPPAMPNATVARINDLTLRVVSPGGTVYWGNHGLDAGVWSASGGQRNTIDTVENVFVESPEAGTWTVEVLAFEINEDGHVETRAIDADFALVVSGICVPGDVTRDGVIDPADIAAVVGEWGVSGPEPTHADVTGDGYVDVYDVIEVARMMTSHAPRREQQESR